MFCYPCHFAGGTSQVESNIKLSSVTSYVESLVIPKCYTRAKHLFTLDAFVLSLLPFPGTSHVGSNIKLSKELPPEEYLNGQMSAISFCTLGLNGRPILKERRNIYKLQN